jgi:hypothetical protein
MESTALDHRRFDALLAAAEKADGGIELTIRKA